VFVVVVEMEEGWGGVFIGVERVAGAGPEAGWFWVRRVCGIFLFRFSEVVRVQLHRSENGFTTSSLRVWSFSTAGYFHSTGLEHLLQIR
jgi:hypothetical protein